MVKGAPKNQASTSTATSSGSALPPTLPSMATGQDPADPLTVLNGPMGHGVMAGLNPFEGMGVNIGDPNLVCIFSLFPSFNNNNIPLDAINDGLSRILPTHVPNHVRSSYTRSSSQ
jgi:ubiquilin